MSDALSVFLARALGEEGMRRFAYNDTTGKTVTCKTMDPPGNLSIGEGINLEVGLDDEEIAWFLQHRAGLVFVQIQKFPWWPTDDAVRGSVLLDVGFNDGLTGLLHFPHMLAAAANKDWVTASAQLLDSDAARALPSRYNPLAQLLLNGQ